MMMVMVTAVVTVVVTVVVVVIMLMPVRKQWKGGPAPVAVAASLFSGSLSTL